MRYATLIVLLSIAAATVWSQADNHVHVTGIYNEEEETTEEQHESVKSIVTDTNQETQANTEVVEEENQEVDEEADTKPEKEAESAESISLTIENGRKELDNLSSHLLIDEWLSLYGILQQMEHGDNTEPRPPKEDFKETAKWEAWKAMSGRSPSYLKSPLSVLSGSYAGRVDRRKQHGPNWYSDH